MWFWIAVAAVLVVLWLLARRVDRRRRVSITRRDPGVEGDAARGTFESNRNRFGESGGGV